MYLIQDRRGRTWITAEGIFRYFRIVIREGAKKYFYDYDWISALLLGSSKTAKFFDKQKKLC